MNDTPLRRFLERVADCAVVGLLVLIASLPLVTALAALTAGSATLGGEGSGSVPTRFLRAFRSALKRAVGPQLVVLGAFVIGLSDLAVGLHWAGRAAVPGWVIAPVLAVGLLLLLGAVVLPSYLAIIAGEHGGPASLGDAVVLAVGRPTAAAAVFGLGITLTAVGVLLPVTLPLLVGAHIQFSRATILRSLSGPVRSLQPTP